MDWGCGNCTKCTRCRSALYDEDWKLAEVHLARKGSIPASITGLQRPPRPASCSMLQCMWCKEQYPNPTKTGAHERGCMWMPYDMWIARTRYCLQIQEGRAEPCSHCGTLFQTRRGAAQHEKNCEQRRTLFKLQLNTHRWHNTAEDAAQL